MATFNAFTHDGWTITWLFPWKVIKNTGFCQKNSMVFKGLHLIYPPNVFVANGQSLVQYSISTLSSLWLGQQIFGLWNGLLVRLNGLYAYLWLLKKKIY